LYGFPHPTYVPYFPKNSIVELVDEALIRREDMIKRVRVYLQHAPKK
jgi:hypothetical protein